MALSLIERKTWGKGLDLKAGWRRDQAKPELLEPRGIVIHHTEEHRKFKQLAREDSKARVRFWFEHHVQHFGWSDLAYHYLIGPDGKIFEGRARHSKGLAQGAHALGNNHRSIGIAMLGNYEEDNLSIPALESLVSLLFYLCAEYNIRVHEIMPWTYTDADRNTKTIHTLRLVGHRDVRYTECPGANLYTQIAQLRSLL